METNATLKAQALVLMLAGRKQKHIAAELKVSTRTLRRWASEPEFAAELKEERDGLFAIARAQAVTRAQIDIEEGIAATRLVAAVCENENMTLQTRMRAAVILMSNSHKSTNFFLKYQDKQEQERQEAQTADESGQKRTLEDLSAIQNQQSEAETSSGDSEIKSLRQRAISAGEAHIKRIDEMERKAVEQAKENNTEPEKIAEMRDGFEEARQAVDKTLSAIEVASLDELRQVCSDPKNPFLNLIAPMSA